MKDTQIQSHPKIVPERRSSVRVNAEIRISYGTGISKLLVGYSIDLSPNGVFLVTTCPFDIDDSVTLKLFIPGGEETVISCSARVAWINDEKKPPKPTFPTGVGLQFVDIRADDKSSIIDFLNSKRQVVT